MFRSIVFCLVLIFFSVEARVFHPFTLAPSNGTGLPTVNSTQPTNSNSTNSINGTIVFGNGTHFLLALHRTINVTSMPVNYSTMSPILNGTINPMTINGSSPDVNTTFIPFTNGTFGIYGNGTHFWQAMNAYNGSHHTAVPVYNATRSPIYNFTMAPIQNGSFSTSFPLNGTFYSPLPPLNTTIKENEKVSPAHRSFSNVGQRPIIINILLDSDQKN